MKLIEFFAKKIKGKDFKLDENISVFYLLSFISSMVINLIRGNMKTILIQKAGLSIFVGRRTKIKMKSKVNLGKGVNIGSNVVIDALSKDGVNIGSNVKIGDYTRILCTGTIRSIGKGFSIGDNCGIGENCFFGAAGGINIGSDVIMGQNVRFHSENHNFEEPDILIRLQGVTNKGIKVGDNCWIGSGVVFLDGAEIGDGCVVAANSVVNKKFNSNSIIAGTPARVIKERGKV